MAAPILTYSQRHTLLELAGVVPLRHKVHTVPGLERRGLTEDGALTTAGQVVVDEYLAEKRRQRVEMMRAAIRRKP